MLLQSVPFQAAPDAYIICLGLFSQVRHPALVEYGCTFRDNILLISNLSPLESNAAPGSLQDLIVQLVQGLSYLVAQDIRPFYAGLLIRDNRLLIKDWHYSLIQDHIDALPPCNDEHVLQRLTDQVLTACNVEAKDLQQDTSLYHAVQTLTTNKSLKDALKQASVILEDCHVLPPSPEEPFYAPLDTKYFLRWAMQFISTKTKRQPSIFAATCGYVPTALDWQPPVPQVSMPPFTTDIQSIYEQHKSSEGFKNGAMVLKSLRSEQYDFGPQVLASWTRPETYLKFLAVSTDHSAYLANIKPIDTETASQIAVDVPRCHAYHPVLSSHTGRQMLRRILEAWCLENKDLEYWQGIDSMAATFLILYLENEHLAFGCFSKFIRTRLSGLFRKGESEFPELLKQCQSRIIAEIPRLTELDIQPDLVTVPWFLTAFSRSPYSHRCAAF